jgi:hypothetical protein
MATTPSAVGDKAPNMKYVRWPDSVTRLVDHLVDAWAANTRDPQHHMYGNRDWLQLTDGTYVTYLKRHTDRSHSGGLNVNEMRFLKQVWAAAVERNAV